MLWYWAKIRVQQVSQDFQAFHQAWSRPTEVSVSIDEIDFTSSDATQFLKAGRTGQDWYVLPGSLNVETAARTVKLHAIIFLLEI